MCARSGYSREAFYWLGLVLQYQQRQCERVSPSQLTELDYSSQRDIWITVYLLASIIVIEVSVLIQLHSLLFWTNHKPCLFIIKYSSLSSRLWRIMPLRPLWHRQKWLQGHLGKSGTNCFKQPWLRMCLWGLGQSVAITDNFHHGSKMPAEWSR